MKIDRGIGWKPNPDNPGRLVSCDIPDYVVEIERLLAALQSIRARLAGPNSGSQAMIAAGMAWGIADKALGKEKP
jgi:hypothetical protein